MTDLKYVEFEKGMRFFYQRHVDFSHILNIIIYTASDFFGGFCDMKIIVMLCKNITSDFFKNEGEFACLMGLCMAELQMVSAIKSNEHEKILYVEHLCKKMFDRSMIFFENKDKEMGVGNGINIVIDEIKKCLKKMFDDEISGKGDDEAAH